MTGGESESASGASGNPYRRPVERKPNDGRARELLYAPLNDTAGRDGLLALYGLFTVPLMLAVAATWVVGPTGGIAGLIGGSAYSAWRWHTRKRVDGAFLGVQDGVLTVAHPGQGIPDERFRLSDLADVTLDLKTIQRVVDGAGAIPATRIISSQVAPKIDTARIVLVDASGHEVRLTKAYLPHLEATDWLGKIRVFLRKQGWVPEDERADPESGAEED